MLGFCSFLLVVAVMAASFYVRGKYIRHPREQEKYEKYEQVSAILDFIIIPIICLLSIVLCWIDAYWIIFWGVSSIGVIFWTVVFCLFLLLSVVKWISSFEPLDWFHSRWMS